MYKNWCSGFKISVTIGYPECRQITVVWNVLKWHYLSEPWHISHQNYVLFYWFCFETHLGSLCLWHCICDLRLWQLYIIIQSDSNLSKFSRWKRCIKIQSLTAFYQNSVSQQIIKIQSLTALYQNSVSDSIVSFWQRYIKIHYIPVLN